MAVPGSKPLRRVRRPNPRIAQAMRTWYFMRRNTLAMVGLGILVAFAVLAIIAVSVPINWNQLNEYCSADYGPTNSNSGYYYYNTTTNMTEPGGPFTGATQTGCTTTMVCTYTVTPPPNAAAYCKGLWYPVPLQAGLIGYPAVIAPTLDLHTLAGGPLPLGSLEVSGVASQSGIYSISDGLIRGSDWSLMISAAIVLTGALSGLFIGAVAGLWGGYIDEVLMRLVDIFLSIPILLFVIVVVTVVNVDVKDFAGLSGVDSSVLLLILGFAAVWWPIYARIVRGQVLVVREQKYVEAARASGSTKGRILFRHIIPNSMYPVFVQFSLDVGTIPLFVGTLVFLGFHIFPTQYFPEWGTVAALSVEQLPDMLTTCQVFGCVIPWWQLAFPGLVLFLWAISVNLLSDGLRDALDPRLRR